MWISTQHGLNRYDGYNFLHFTTENSNLVSNSVNSIQEDDQQRIWITYKDTYDISILNLRDMVIRPFDEVFSEVPFTPISDSFSEFEDQGRKLFSTESGEVFVYETNTFVKVFEWSKPERLLVLHAENDHLWFSTPDDELLKVNFRGEIEFNFDFDFNLVGIGVDPTNKFWLLERSFSLYTIDEQNQIKKEELNSVDFNKTNRRVEAQKLFELTAQGQLLWWYRLSSDVGREATPHFKLYDPKEGTTVDLQKEIESFFTYRSPRVMGMFFDSTNRIWLATDDGVLILNVKRNKFDTLLTSGGGYSIRGIIKDDLGNLHINNLQGRILVDAENRIRRIRSSYWLGATKDDQGNLWFSHHQSYIEKYDPKTSESTTIRYNPEVGKSMWSQWAILHDGNGGVWTGASSGIFYLDLATGKFEKYNDYNEWPELGEDYVYHLAKGDDCIWVCSDLGLFRLEPGKGVTARYGSDEAPPFRIPVDQILHLYEDKDGIFWLATEGGGLVRLDIQKGDFQQYTQIDGLSSDIIYGVYEDEFGKLWLPSNYGLMAFDKTTHEVTTFLTGDGIAHNEFNTISHYKDDDGKLYFGGLSGVTIVEPSRFVIGTDTTDIPIQIISGKTLDGRTGELIDKTYEVANTGAIKLRPSDRSFVLDFALLNYDQAYKNSYAYMIEGLDNDWNYIRENTLRMNSLPYGDYVLRVKGRGATGKWSRQEVKIVLSILRPLYLQLWFIASGAVMILLFIYAGFRWRLQNLKLAQARLQEMVEERTQTISYQKDQIEKQAEDLKALDKAKSRFFANISHELRTPLTLILGYLNNILQDKTEMVHEEIKSGLIISKQNGDRLLTLTEEILDLSKLEAGQLKLVKKPLALYPFVSRVLDGYHSFVHQKDVTLSLAFGLSQDAVLNVDEAKLDKVINNLISNAVKFTDPGGSIRMSVAIEKASENGSDSPRLNITVADDGRGIHSKDLPHVFDRFYQSEHADNLTEGGTGIGLALSKELAALMNGELTVESTLGKGSTFTFKFPAEFVSHSYGTDKSESITKALNTQVQPSQKTSDVRDTKQKKKSKYTVLLVEDHPEMRAFVRQILVESYDVLEAVDGVDGLEKLQESNVDLIVSDVMMPRLDGFGLLKEVRKSEDWMDIPLMMLTARASGDDKLQAFHIGVDDYLTKPFEPQELEARIKNLLKNRQRRQKQIEKRIESKDAKETLPAFDRAFAEQARKVVEREIANTAFGNIDLAEELHVSQRQLTRKMKRTVGLSPLQFIREVKLQKARALFENREKETVAEVMHSVGIQSSGYFAKIYFERFGKQPSEYY